MNFMLPVKFKYLITITTYQHISNKHNDGIYTST